MRVVLLTQDEPLFLAPSVDYLLSRKPHQVHVVGCVVFDPSPLGKKIGIASRAKELLRVFGTAYSCAMPRVSRRRVRAVAAGEQHLAKTWRRELRLEENVNARSSLEAIRALQPDLLVSVAGNQIFRAAPLEVAPEGCLNVHSALLPRYRGLMPTFWVLKEWREGNGRIRIPRRPRASIPALSWFRSVCRSRPTASKT